MTSLVLLSGCNEQKPAPVSDETRAVQLVHYFNGEPFPTGLNFTNALRQAVPPSKLRLAWKNMQVQDGAFQNITKTRVTPYGNYTLVYVTCQFANSTVIDVQVAFDQQHVVSGIYFVSPYQPPAYANANNFTESQVTIGAGTEYPLSGTLSMPKGTGPFPVVVLVHGSGPNDRNESILSEEPFKDLAWGLASTGIAVLRYEKRTRQYARQMAAQLDNLTVYQETVQDAQRAVALLQSTPGINTSQIYVLGHSLGGMLAPRIAANDTGIAGLIMMAAPARHLEDLVINQTRYLASLDTNASHQWPKVIQDMTVNVTKIKNPENISSREIVFYAAKPYWTDLKTYNQVQTAANLSLPMLFLQGQRDYQVNYTDDFLRWKTALANHPNVTFKSFPNLTHLFMNGSNPPSNADYATPSNVAKYVINDISAWIKNTDR